MRRLEAEKKMWGPSRVGAPASWWGPMPSPESKEIRNHVVLSRVALCGRDHLRCSQGSDRHSVLPSKDIIHGIWMCDDVLSGKIFAESVSIVLFWEADVWLGIFVSLSVNWNYIGCKLFRLADLLADTRLPTNIIRLKNWLRKIEIDNSSGLQMRWPNETLMWAY